MHGASAAARDVCATTDRAILRSASNLLKTKSLQASLSVQPATTDSRSRPDKMLQAFLKVLLLTALPLHPLTSKITTTTATPLHHSLLPSFLQNPNLNSNHNLTLPPSSPIDEIRCRISLPEHHLPAHLALCQRTFDAWLSSPSIDLPVIYHRPGRDRIVLSHAPCVVSLDRMGPGIGGELITSLRSIIVDATQVLLFCRRWGEGGVMMIGGTTDWALLVEGG